MQLNSFKDINTSHRHIYLSPHLDDAVYSCGGTIGVQISSGLRPLVITIFAGIPAKDLELSPLASRVIKEMGGNEGVDVLVENRRKEDADALTYLGTDYLWLDYQDAIFRGSPAYYTTHQELIGGEVHPADLWIDKQLAAELVKLHERLPDAVWYAPLGIGRHVDHQIVSSAADRLTQLGANVKYYEDFPYVLREDALETRLQELGNVFEPALVEVSEMLPMRRMAADKYESQIKPNFGDQTNMHTKITEYTRNIRPVESIHLERYWTVR